MSMSLIGLVVSIVALVVATTQLGIDLYRLWKEID